MATQPPYQPLDSLTKGKANASRSGNLVGGLAPHALPNEPKSCKQSETLLENTRAPSPIDWFHPFLVGVYPFACSTASTLPCRARALSAHPPTASLSHIPTIPRTHCRILWEQSRPPPACPRPPPRLYTLTLAFTMVLSACPRPACYPNTIPWCLIYDFALLSCRWTTAWPFPYHVPLCGS